MKQRSVTVLGMHRSGTSLVAGVLKRLGVDMGEGNPPAIMWDNPLGQTEDAKFVALDNAILKAAGGSWDEPPSHEAILQQKDKFDGEIKALIESKKSPIWGWKTARNCLTIELYYPHLPDPYFVTCERSVEGVIQSLMRRDGMKESAVSELYNTYYSRLDAFTQSHQLPVISFQYEKISAYKTDFIDVMSDFLGLRVNSDMRNRAIDSILPHKVVRELSDNMRLMSDIKLDIGCGSDKADGWVGMDIRPLDGVDVVWDIANFPWPFANDSCNEMNMDQVWETVEPKYRMRMMDELWRMAKIDCQLTIKAPHANTFGAAQDPTHYGCPNDATFWYFDPRHPRYAEYTPLPWTLVGYGMRGNNVVAVLSPMKKAPNA